MALNANPEASSSSGEFFSPPSPAEVLKKELEQTRRLLEFLEFYTTNGLAKPLFDTREKPPEEVDPLDTLARLEQINRLPDKEYFRELIGALFPLSADSSGEWLLVLKDGTVMRLERRKRLPTPQVFTKRITNMPAFERVDLLRRVKIDPSDGLGYQGGFDVVYRTDIALDGETAQSVLTRADKDLQTAAQVSLDRQEMIREQLRSSREMILKHLKLPVS